MTPERQTNQQLAFARVQHGALVQAADAMARRAHAQAAVWQLAQGLGSYAEEIKQLAKVKTSFMFGQGSFRQLHNAFSREGKASASLQELVRLEQEEGSWLYLLELWYAVLPELPLADAKTSVRSETTLTQHNNKPGRPDVIAVAQEPAEAITIDDSRLQGVIDDAWALVQRQRHDSAEY